MTPAEAVSCVRAVAVAVVWISIATSAAFVAALVVGHSWQALRALREPKHERPHPGATKPTASEFDALIARAKLSAFPPLDS